MEQEIDIQIYPTPASKNGEALFSNALTDTVVEVYEELVPDSHASGYSTEQIRTHLGRLLNAVSIEQHLQLDIAEKDFSWQKFLRIMEENFPQIIWIAGFREEGLDQMWQYSFDFLPLALKGEGFPISFNLNTCLKQNNIQSIAQWRKEIRRIAQEVIDQEEAEREAVEGVQAPSEEPVAVETPAEPEEMVTEMVDEPTWMPEEPEADFDEELLADFNEEDQLDVLFDEEDELEAEDEPIAVEEPVEVEEEEFVVEEPEVEVAPEPIQEKPKQPAKPTQATATVDQEVDERHQEYRQLVNKGTSMTGKMSGRPPKDPALRADYFETAYKLEKAAKERMQIARDKSDQQLIILEEQMLTNGLDALETLMAHPANKDDFKRLKLGLVEYEQLFDKANYLEEIYEKNQQLTSMTESLRISKSDFGYEIERVQKVKKSSNEAEIFFMMNQCERIDKRTEKKVTFFRRIPSAYVYKYDYEVLLRRAAYFDLLRAENQLLDSMISLAVDQKFSEQEKLSEPEEKE